MKTRRKRKQRIYKFSVPTICRKSNGSVPQQFRTAACFTSKPKPFPYLIPSSLNVLINFPPTLNRWSDKPGEIRNTGVVQNHNRCRQKQLKNPRSGGEGNTRNGEHADVKEVFLGVGGGEAEEENADGSDPEGVDEDGTEAEALMSGASVGIHFFYGVQRINVCLRMISF